MELPQGAASCPQCGAPLGGPGYREHAVCDACGYHFPLGARRWLDLLLDRGSFRETDGNLVSVDPLHFSDLLPYPERLSRAERATGLRDAVVTGVGSIRGRPCVVAVSDFRFLGGSMGSVVGQKVARAMELAARARLPFVAVTSSGGARLQEGMLSLVQMAKTGATAARLHRAGVPFVCVLTNPTTGGVLASYATQGDILLAEPGALIGFAGPRVVREVTGQELLPDFQTAEFLLGHGLIDAVVERPRLRGTLGTLLDLGAAWPHPLAPSPASLERGKLRTPGEGIPDPLSLWERVRVRASSLGRHGRRSHAPAVSAWEAIGMARHPERPTAVDYLNRVLSRFVELHGDRAGADDPAIVGGIGELGGMTVVVIVQERGRGADAARRKGGRAGPGGYRKALRLMRLATNLRLPLLTLVDTPGAELSVDAEAGGLAWTISACLAELSALPTPVVSVVIGEGGSGGALALGVGDRVLMLENAIYSVIAPEGAAAILYHSRDRAPEIAAALKLTAADCRRLGVVDVVVAEPPGGAHRDADRAAAHLGEAILVALEELSRVPAAKLVEARYRKYQGMGRYDTRLHRLVVDWLADARSAAARAVGRLLGAVDRRPLTPREDSARDTYVEATRSGQDGD